MSKVIVIGGSGFIGSHIVEKLFDMGHEPICATRRPESKSQESNIQTLQMDIIKDDTQKLTQLLNSIDTVIFAAGIDERATPKGDAYKFFARNNIRPLEKIISVAKAAGVSNLIVLNSIFSYLDRTYPEKKLAVHHPYIRSRVHQRDIALEHANSTFKVYVLEIPYVFGGNQDQQTQWARLIDFVRSPSPLFLTRGGANMLSVRTIANACLGIIENNPPSGAYPIGDKNLTWRELLELIAKGLNEKKRNFVEVPANTFDQLSRLGGLMKSLFHVNSGLDSKHIVDIVTMDMFFDSSESQQVLGYQAENLDQAIKETILMAPKRSKWESLISVTKI